MSEELDEIDEKLAEDNNLKQRQSIKRNKMFMDFDLLATNNPRETNQTIFKAIILLSLLAAAYVVSFYI